MLEDLLLYKHTTELIEMNIEAGICFYMMLEHMNPSKQERLFVMGRENGKVKEYLVVSSW